MTNRTLFNLLTTFLFIACANAQNITSKLIGKWQTDEKDVIEFYLVKDKICGKLVATGDEALQKQNPEIIGSVIFTELKFENGAFKDGKYLDLESRKMYPVKIELINGNRLKAVFGSGLFTETRTMTKI